MATRVTRSRRQPPDSNKQESQTRAKWTEPLTKILVDIMVDEIRKGNNYNKKKKKKSFTNDAWQSIGYEYWKRTGFKWDKEQLKSKFSVLRKQYDTVKSILGHGDDFSWDASIGLIIATDEAWFKYIEEHPEAETIKTNGCPLYNELCIIFSGETDNGKYDQRLPIYNENTSCSRPPCPEPVSVFYEESSYLSEEDEDDAADELEKVQSTTFSTTISRKRGRKGIDDIIAKSIMEMASASRLKTAAISQHKAKFSIRNCVKELDELLGVDEQVYFGALDLFDNPIFREFFLSLKADKRLTWLKGKILLHLVT